MGFSGGTWTPPSLPGSWSPAISGQAATPTDWNTLLAAIAAGLSTMICRDGQSTVVADIPFSGFRLKGVGNGVLSTDAANMSQLVSGAGVYAADTGSVDAIAIAPAPAISAYAVGQKFRFKANHTTTSTAPTAAVNGLTAGTIFCPDGTALVAGAIVIGGFYEITVSNAATPTFQLGATISATAAQAANSIKNASTAYVDRVAVQQVVVTQTGAVATGSTQTPYDDTIPQISEGDQYMSLSITPKSATSKLVISVVASCSCNQADNIIVALFQDSGNDALAATVVNLLQVGGMINPSFVYEMTSGTTSSTTFKIRIGASSGGGTITFNGSLNNRLLGGVLASSITITEIGI